MRTILIHGPAGSGKDTQVDLILKAHPTFQKIGSGEMFRKLLTIDSPLKSEAVKAYAYWSEGKPVPSDLTYKMLAYWISQNYDNNKDWIFVSTVRSADQIRLFDELLQKFNRKLDLFVHLKLSEFEAIRRLSARRYCPTCQATYHTQFKKPLVLGKCDVDGEALVIREDDTPNKIKLRYKEQYQDTINDIENAYKNRDIAVVVDASNSIEKIKEDLWAELFTNKVN